MNPWDVPECAEGHFKVQRGLNFCHSPVLCLLPGCDRSWHSLLAAAAGAGVPGCCWGAAHTLQLSVPEEWSSPCIPYRAALKIPWSVCSSPHQPSVSGIPGSDPGILAAATGWFGGAWAEGRGCVLALLHILPAWQILGDRGTARCRLAMGTW